MKQHLWRRFVRDHLRPSLPDYQFQGDLLVYGTVEWMLHAVAYESSPYSTTHIALWVFSQPLFIPIEHLWFSYGDRLWNPQANSEWWDIESDTTIERMSTQITGGMDDLYRQTIAVRDMAMYSERRYPSSMNPPIIEGEAYAWLLAGEPTKATRAFVRLQKAVEAMPPFKTWGPPILARARRVQAAMDAGDDAAVRLLDEWRHQTLHHLKL